MTLCKICGKGENATGVQHFDVQLNQTEGHLNFSITIFATKYATMSPAHSIDLCRECAVRAADAFVTIEKEGVLAMVEKDSK